MNGKNVLVTGSSRGIGAATACAFARKGYHVFLNCRQSRDELEAVRQSIEAEGNGSCSLLIGDVGNADDVRLLFDKIYAQCDALDVLINNAGTAHVGLLMDMTDEEWAQIIQNDLSSVFYCCRSAIGPMIHRQQGKIINISSVWGVEGGSCEAAYSAAKAGVCGLTKALAKELALSNIQVNALACGVIDTTMNDQLNQEEKEQLAAAIPAGRFGTPEEVAQLVLQLADAPAYLTGQIIGIDGGF